MNILTDEDKVDAAEAELRDAEEDVGDDPGGPGGAGPAQPRGRGQEGGVGDVRVGEVGGPRPPTQLLGVDDQQVHAVHADHTHGHQTWRVLCHRGQVYL